MADNIALVVFSPERTDGTTESDLIEALKGKYDALKDKLLAEALIKQVNFIPQKQTLKPLMICNEYWRVNYRQTCLKGHLYKAIASIKGHIF